MQTEPTSKITNEQKDQALLKKKGEKYTLPEGFQMANNFSQ